MTRNIRSKKVGGGAMVTPHVARMAAPASVQKEKQEQSQVGQNANTAQNEVEIKLEAAMQQKQSQELVQIMLNASSESNPSYEDFVGPSAKTGASRKSQPLRILLRNRDATADAVLDLLEYGIFDALGKRVLEAVQLTISRDKDKPLQVLESYTFTFAYNHGDKRKAGNLRSVTLGNDEFTMEMATFRSAKIGLEMVIRRLITLSTILPNLPCMDLTTINYFFHFVNK
ncbi:hypothetical protein PRK78_006147 [Emydomyces testavorans]|uniref:HORMA domain-containing protein n=1 Tax=Emydomyces testavorans TaxID=2070801 RepID=A0AAF0DKV8_9EURO|nr:hypothetical protein PRK78_006147 [Emydomyces testavorans]